MNALKHALANALVARSLWSPVARVQETKFTHFVWKTPAVLKDTIPSSTDLQSKQSASEY